jgi:hypothetical protein
MQRVSLSLFAIVLLAAEMFGPALGQPTPNSEIAPTGKLRAAVIGIRVLGGVGEPIGKFIAANLGVPFESVIYPNPDAYEQSFGKGQWDIAIGAACARSCRQRGCHAGCLADRAFVSCGSRTRIRERRSGGSPWREGRRHSEQPIGSVPNPDAEIGAACTLTVEPELPGGRNRIAAQRQSGRFWSRLGTD